jgi:hypothetical protein
LEKSFLTGLDTFAILLFADRNRKQLEMDEATKIRVVPDKRGGFNRSMQHYFDANLLRIQEPKSFNSNKNTALSRLDLL